MNSQAFRVGRLLVADPAWARTVVRRRLGAIESARELSAQARSLVDSVGEAGELKRLLEIRVPELIAYKSAGYARSYVQFVKRVREAEAAQVPGETRLSEAVARYLFKLMAYKDEYEVARLSLKPDIARALAEEFPGGVKLAYNLHPPLLRALGLKEKLKLGLDPFGFAAVRRVERQLADEYRALVEKALVGLSPESYERAVKLAGLPDVIRGYEEIKLRNVQRFRDEVRALGF
jgi:indolepyruvate ferredoxin oxidoreductase